VHEQLVAAGRGITAEKGANCCYAVSDKYWVTDPAGVAWETFHSLGTIPMYGSGADPATACGTGEGVCCGPSTAPAEASSSVRQRSCCGTAE
jgi:hypothetical protein